MRVNQLTDVWAFKNKYDRNKGNGSTQPVQRLHSYEIRDAHWTAQNGSTAAKTTFNKCGMAALSPEKELLLPTEKDTGTAPELVWAVSSSRQEFNLTSQSYSP
jgi:hypothetical protein